MLNMLKLQVTSMFMVSLCMCMCIDYFDCFIIATACCGDGYVSVCVSFKGSDKIAGAGISAIISHNSQSYWLPDTWNQ